MRPHSLLTLITTSWLLAIHPAFADESGAGGPKTTGTTTNATTGTNETPDDDSMFEPGPSPQKIRGGGNIEWRRNDHSNARSSAGGRSGGNSSKSGGGSDGSGGGGGGSSD
jgi:hypothetical protein